MAMTFDREQLRRHRDQRGAALFLVVLVVSLITAIGIFSMRSASLVNVASGFNRQNVQAAMLARLAARAAVTAINEDTNIVNTEAKVDGCATDYVDGDSTGRAFCNVMPSAQINSKLDLVLAGLDGSPDLDNLTHRAVGVLSSVDGTGTGITGSYSAELTGLSPGGLAPETIVEVTVTATAKVFPYVGADGDNAISLCAAGAQEAVSQQTVRATVEVVVIK